MIPLPPGAEKWTAVERVSGACGANHRHRATASGDTEPARGRPLAIAVLSGETVVVNVRKGGPHRRLVPWLVEEGLLTYVGHAGPRHHWPESDFANPFINLASKNRATMVDSYREWLHERPELLRRIPEELAGRALGCWCAPAPCHADVLAEEARRAG